MSTATLAPAAGALYATARRGRTLGGRVAVVAGALGEPLMPWQRYVADVASELHPTEPDRWRYPVVVVTVPRQSGKTTLLRAVAVDRAMGSPGTSVFMTAQTGKDAVERWKDVVSRIETSPLGPHVSVYRGASAPTVWFPNRSRVRAFAPTPKSVHGYTLPCVMIDEAWAFDQVSGEDLLAAVEPTQITRADRQLWIVSTKGTADSAFLNRYIDLGRLAVNDPGASVAYFEWAAPDGADPYDRDTWAFHPALGHTITLDDLADAAASTSRGNWERSYLNRQTASSETVIDLDVWDSRRADQSPPDDPSRLHLAYDVAYDTSGASVWAGWVDAEDRAHVRLYAQDAGVAWLADYIATARRTVRPASITADDGGPARGVTDELTRRGVVVETLGARDFATAWTGFKRAIAEGTMDHDGSPGIRAGLEVLTERFLADQTAPDRRRSAGPIDHVTAAAMALRATRQAPPPAPRPSVYFGR